MPEANYTELQRPSEDSTIKQLVELANAQAEYIKLVDETTEALKEQKEKLKKLSTQEIPNLMKDLGIEQLTLSSGQTISIKKSYFASIPKAKTAEAMAWLDDNGYGDAVKRIIAAQTPKDEATKKSLTEFLYDNEIDFDINQNIHAQTLKKIVKETMEAGKEIPLEAFGVYVENTSVIK